MANPFNVLEPSSRLRSIDYPGLDDAGLVSLARLGDERAIRLLIKRYNQRLFRAARSILRSDAEAEDAVQAAYASAFTHLGDFRGDANMATWLTRITLNEALGRLRRRRPTEPLDAMIEEESEPVRSDEPSPEEEAARNEAAQLIERMVDRLAPAFRSVFVLRDVEGLSTEETAKLLNIPIETVKSRLHRARRDLRVKIESQLKGSFGAIYPFDGQRCALMADRVIQAMKQP